MCGEIAEYNKRLREKQIELLEKIDELTDKLFDTRTRLEILDNNRVLKFRRLESLLNRHYCADCPVCVEVKLILSKEKETKEKENETNLY